MTTFPGPLNKTFWQFEKFPSLSQKAGTKVQGRRRVGRRAGGCAGPEARRPLRRRARQRPDPLLWLSLLSWLEPPYIYLVINGIIVTIAASSRLHGNLHEAEEARVVSAAAESSGDGVLFLPPGGMACLSPVEDVAHGESGPAGVPEAEIAERSVDEGGDGRGDRAEAEEEEEFMISRSAWTPAAKGSNAAERLPTPEKPLVSSRFVHRRPSKASPEALGVIRPKRQETLENTWKAITDGRPVPLAARRRLRKSDTWGENKQREPLDQAPAPAMRKSETFRDRTNELASPSQGKASPAKGSPSQDELNRRVEAFIQKFNQEMRLQRQESFEQYNAMMNRGL
ncbi:uncharacterized protein LOC104445350 [Eucalyptus grandis]|uniref:uncharacterized protein LOC104445350 n=1 Tax=Eucalyptus grandis TaxID=71139 RepID=UPI00192E9BBD|nr:uncharacterized protein LOC104445350 [Eucalyptus grandis]